MQNKPDWLLMFLQSWKGETPWEKYQEREGGGGQGKEQGSLGNKWGFAGSSPSVIHYHIST